MTARDALGFLKTKSRSYLADWLTDALVEHYGEDNPDAFYPHSSFGADGDPIFTICHVYRNSPAFIQTRLRSAIAGSTVLALNGAAIARVPKYDLEKRLGLLSVVCTLASETGCVDGIPRLTDSATVGLETWGTEEQRTRAFALVLRCVADLSISSESHSNLTGSALKALESNLTRLIFSDGFRPQYAPRCAHALLLLNPGTFFRYYDEVLGRHIQDFHAIDKEEEEHSYATADIIAERSKIELMRFASKLQVAGPEPRDLWLLNAWNRPSSKFLLFRKGKDPNRLFLTKRQRSGSGLRLPIALDNPNFYKIELTSDIQDIVSEELFRNHIGALAAASMKSILRGSAQLNERAASTRIDTAAFASMKNEERRIQAAGWY